MEAPTPTTPVVTALKVKSGGVKVTASDVDGGLVLLPALEVTVNDPDRKV